MDSLSRISLMHLMAFSRWVSWRDLLVNEYLMNIINTRLHQRKYIGVNLLLIHAKLEVDVKRWHFLSYNFAEVCTTLACGGRKKKFRTISAGTAMLQNCKIPYVRFQVVWKHFPDWAWCLLRTKLLFFCWSLSCSSLHTFNPITLLRRAAPRWSKSIYVRAAWS